VFINVIGYFRLQPAYAETQDTVVWLYLNLPASQTASRELPCVSRLFVISLTVLAASLRNMLIYQALGDLVKL